MDADSTITVSEGYRAMIAFLEAYWERGLKSSDDIAVLLGAMDLIAPNRPLDIAQWHDWLDAVKAIKQ
jgi:hypothetical protein